MTEVTFFIPSWDSCSPWNQHQYEAWRGYLGTNFRDFTQGPPQRGCWGGILENTTPYILLLESREDVPFIVAKIKELFHQKAVYVRYGEAEIL